MTGDVAALKAESERLFAVHQELLQDVEPRAHARSAEMARTATRLSEAYAASETAAGRWETGRLLLALDPSDAARVAAEASLRRAYLEAEDHAVSVYREVSAVQNRIVEESGVDTARIVAAGDAFRAAQDAYFAAMTGSPAAGA